MGCACNKKVIDSGRMKLNQLHSVNLSARKMFLLAVVRPCLEYGNEVRECNKGQAYWGVLIELFF